MKRRLSACRTPLDVRKAFNSSAPITPKGVRFSQAILGGVSGEWAEAKKHVTELGTLLYAHGGGYAAMSPRTHRGITGGFALRGLRVFTPDYRLAPEHLFPTAVDDIYAAWRGLRGQVDGPIFIAGDSSGGGLAAALLLKLRDLGEQGPVGACLFSPWTDLAVTGSSLEVNRGRDPMQVADCFRMLATSYLGGADPRTPLASPIYGNLAGIPPMLVFVGDTEILLDDAKRLVARAQSDGVAADLRIYRDMPHSWPLLNVILPEGRQALDESIAFLQSAALTALMPKPERTPSPQIAQAGIGLRIA